MMNLFKLFLKPIDVSALDDMRLHDIMKNNIAGWDFAGKQRVANYGVQRCYERRKKSDFVDATEDQQLMWRK